MRAEKSEFSQQLLNSEGCDAERADGKQHAAIPQRLEFVHAQVRCLAELRHVGEQRHLDICPLHFQRKGVEFVRGEQGLGEECVGAGLGIGKGSLNGSLQPIDGPCVRARHKDEIPIAFRFYGCCDLGNHVTCWNQSFA